jgi:hypothetical protein
MPNKNNVLHGNGLGGGALIGASLRLSGAV